MRKTLNHSLRNPLSILIVTSLKRQKTAPKPTSWKGFHKAFSLGSLRPHKETVLPFLDRVGGTFVEIGAHDGTKNSFSVYLEKALGWRGLLIEPWPHLFHQCRKSRKYSVAVNAAAVDATLEDSYIEVEGLPPQTSVREALRLEVAKRKSADAAIKPPSPRKQACKISYINTDRIDNILKKAEFDQDFNLLILNLKGYEDYALKGFSFERYRPAFILAHVGVLTKTIANIPLYYQPIARSQHDRISRVILYRLADFGNN